VVVSRESQYLVGFVLRRDLNLAIGKTGWKEAVAIKIISRSNIILYLSDYKVASNVTCLHFTGLIF
jgi:hypothetical protein